MSYILNRKLNQAHFRPSVRLAVVLDGRSWPDCWDILLQPSSKLGSAAEKIDFPDLRSACNFRLRLRRRLTEKMSSHQLRSGRSEATSAQHPARKAAGAKSEAVGGASYRIP